MDDGNILVRYNQPAGNIVISDFADQHIAAINEVHPDGQAREKVPITPKGRNEFGEFGINAFLRSNTHVHGCAKSASRHNLSLQDGRVAGRRFPGVIPGGTIQSNGCYRPLAAAQKEAFRLS